MSVLSSQFLKLFEVRFSLRGEEKKSLLLPSFRFVSMSEECSFLRQTLGCDCEKAALQNIARKLWAWSGLFVWRVWVHVANFWIGFYGIFTNVWLLCRRSVAAPAKDVVVRASRKELPPRVKRHQKSQKPPKERVVVNQYSDTRVCVSYVVSVLMLGHECSESLCLSDTVSCYNFVLS